MIGIFTTSEIISGYRKGTVKAREILESMSEGDKEKVRADVARKQCGECDIFSLGADLSIPINEIGLVEELTKFATEEDDIALLQYSKSFEFVLNKLKENDMRSMLPPLGGEGQGEGGSLQGGSLLGGEGQGEGGSSGEEQGERVIWIESAFQNVFSVIAFITVIGTFAQQIQDLWSSLGWGEKVLPVKAEEHEPVEVVDEAVDEAGKVVNEAALKKAESKAAKLAKLAQERKIDFWSNVGVSSVLTVVGVSVAYMLLKPKQ